MDYLFFFFFTAFLSLNDVISSFEIGFTALAAAEGWRAAVSFAPRPFVFCSPGFFIRVQGRDSAYSCPQTGIFFETYD